MIKIIGDKLPRRDEKGFNTKESSIKTEGRNVPDHVEQVNESAFKVTMNKKQLHQSKGSIKQAPGSSLFSTTIENAPRMKAMKNTKN